jgi:hypothetical protein
VGAGFARGSSVHAAPHAMAAAHTKDALHRGTRRARASAIIAPRFTHSRAPVNNRERAGV